MADERTPTEQTPDPGNDTETTTDTPSDDEMAVELVLENQSDQFRSGTIEMSHLLTPACRYVTPECGRPAERTTALETSFDLASATQQSLQPVTMGINSAADTVDSYSVEVSTGSRTGTLRGLEAGAASTVGRDQAGDYPWRVVARHYQVRVIITSDDIEITVQSVS